MQGEKYYDVRGLAVLTDHKKAVLMIVQKLVNDGYLSGDSIEDCRGILNDVQSARNLYLKYSIIPEQELILRIRDKLIRIHEKEKYALDKIIMNL
ncbi:hypothetical protein [Cohnella soli]|uniref:Uncharacterized protein n=1 Tax=Cohnella soli TaxID=425005 RepID=A0ABW0I3Z4_9BACL